MSKSDSANFDPRIGSSLCLTLFISRLAVNLIAGVDLTLTNTFTPGAADRRDLLRPGGWARDA